jgi:polysaccharide deacetylase 2 family uncharacterized protein YibQ
LIVVVLIAAVFFLLERSRRSAPPGKVVAIVHPEATSHLQIPPHPKVQQPSRSSASLPVVKPSRAVVQRHKGTCQVAIIVDDMGSSMSEIQSLLSIGLPLTFSVIPALAHSKGVAVSAHDAGAQVMVHMPMEPEGYPKKRLEEIGLLLAMQDAEVEARVNGYFSSVPFAVGANNHMGSRYTQNAEKMGVVLKVLKEKGMFFLDSRTSPASVGYQTARALGLKCGTRQVFLDNVQNESAIGRQLAEVVAIARKKGGAIAICHPHPATIRLLKSMMPELARSGVTFVHASNLMT